MAEFIEQCEQNKAKRVLFRFLSSDGSSRREDAGLQRGSGQLAQAGGAPGAAVGWSQRARAEDLSVRDIFECLARAFPCPPDPGQTLTTRPAAFRRITCHPFIDSREIVRVMIAKSCGDVGNREPLVPQKMLRHLHSYHVVVISQRVTGNTFKEAAKVGLGGRSHFASS